MTRTPHPTPPAGSLPAPGSYRHVVDERTPPAGLPQSHLRGLGTDPQAPPRSALYAQAIDAAPDDVGRWQVNKEWTGRALDDHDEAVRRTGRLADGVARLSSAVEALKPLSGLYTALKSAVDEMQLAVGIELGVNGTAVQKNTAADAKAVERIVQLEGDLTSTKDELSEAKEELARVRRIAVAKQVGAFVGAGASVGAIVQAILKIMEHLPK